MSERIHEKERHEPVANGLVFADAFESTDLLLVAGSGASKAAQPPKAANPTKRRSRSPCRQTAPFKRLFSKIQCMSTEMPNCMFGPSRRKLTRLIHHIQAFHHLNQMCDNQCEHEPWGQKPDGSWAAAEETAYPWPLDRAAAQPITRPRNRVSCA